MPDDDTGREAGVPARIGLLADSPQAIPTLARWFRDEWRSWYGPGAPGSAERDLKACCNRDTLPIALVALGSDSTVLGTAALKAESVGSEAAPGPWLAAFLVARAYRRKGVGTALIRAIEIMADDLGFATLYTSTDTANALLKRCGWRAVNQASSVRGSVTVYRKDL